MRALLCAAAVPLPASAAQLTEVAPATGADKRIELKLDALFVHRRADTRIGREILLSGEVVVADELDHVRTVDETDFRLAVGLYPGIEFRFLVPLVVRDVQEWDYATVGGSSVRAQSSMANNTIGPSGCLGARNCTALQPIVAAPGRSSHSGLGDPTVGIAWAPIDEAREMRLRPDAFPPGTPVATWAMGIDYTLPAPADLDSPAVFGPAAAAPNARSTGESRKGHAITGWMAFSKRFRDFDPYLKLSGTYAFAPGGAFDGCAANPATLADVAAANCGAPAWRSQTRYKPPPEGALLIGSEWVLHEEPRESRKVFLDLRGEARYVGRGRTYTQASDMLGKLTYSDDYLSTAGTLALEARLASWFHARIEGGVAYDTPHFLTTEEVGKDLDGNGRIDISGSPGVAAPEQNPLYDFRVDQVGRRLRAQRAVAWSAGGSIGIVF